MAALQADSTSNSHGDVNASPVYEIVPGTLLHLLSNSLILAHTAPYLSVQAVLNLAASSRAYHALVHSSPSAFRYLDLSNLRSAQFHIAPIDRGGETWRNVQVDENLTEDEFYSGPIRGAFNTLERRGWLGGVHTLILDNVSVTAELVHEILRDPSYNVRILSLRNAKHLNESQLQRALRLACRASRPDGTPKLKGLYIFGGGTGWAEDIHAMVDGHTGELHQPLSGDDLWYRSRGRVLSRRTRATEWADTLMDCRGVLAFDGVLCAGPRHPNSPAYGKLPAFSDSGKAGFIITARHHMPMPSQQPTTFSMAHFSLDGCAGCGSAPEGWTMWGDDGSEAEMVASNGGYVSRYPLLWPPPRFSSNVRVAMCPEGESVHPHRFRRSDIVDVDLGVGGNKGKGRGEGHSSELSGPLAQAQPSRFIARCEWCVYERLCAVCHRWWCESCIPDPLNDEPAAAASPASANPGSSSSKSLIGYSCRECGPSCHECLAKTQRRCKRCRQSYCITHNLGSSLTHCDWCNTPSYRYVQQPRVSLKSRY